MKETDLNPLLRRIADALERLAPAAAAVNDLAAADAFIWHADREWLEPVPVVNLYAIAGPTEKGYIAVGTQRALHSANGLPSRPTIASRRLGFLIPPDVRSSFMMPPVMACPANCAVLTGAT